MRTLLKIVTGFVFSLIGALIIHAFVLEKRTDIYTVAYCAPQAIVAPVFFLNSAALADGLYYKEKFAADDRRANFDREKVHSETTVKGAGLSAILTALFWIPFFFKRRKSPTTKSAIESREKLEAEQDEDPKPDNAPS